MYVSSEPTKNAVFLNDYLREDPPHQNSMYDISVRSRIRPILLCRHIEKDNLQNNNTGVWENILSFNWVTSWNRNRVEINSVTGLVYPLTQSVIKAWGYTQSTSPKLYYPKIIENILHNKYV